MPHSTCVVRGRGESREVWSEKNDIYAEMCVTKNNIIENELETGDSWPV